MERGAARPAVARRRLGERLLGASAAIFVSTLISLLVLAAPGPGPDAVPAGGPPSPPSSPPPPEPEAPAPGTGDGGAGAATLVLVALIGAVPSTVTAVTGLVLVLRTTRPGPRPADSPGDPDPGS
jgi:hypothetical protein